ncbi:MAG TPA: TetR/AcrR family transcriptional regulator [Aliidongia sp.]|uniref:TetR/AcrR family transcriptional regulator n=1 Tax=Aliidongia sp. TaxID=1914230 RepID=UPI002DDD36A6|nr:TetR/AcrR family transcriptional regulator [Aliidongia sp.]HEV2674038.1 TetR/AcrR family transcriptional regulator [Aliidongia sp.]
MSGARKLVPEPSIDKPTARDRILNVASDLFYHQGVRAVGIDTIIAAAGVAKMSLYRAFPSKDDLVAAYLEKRNLEFWERWDRTIADYPGDPRAQLEGLLDAITQRTLSEAYRGCPFLNTATEFPGSTLPADTVIRAHKRVVNERLRAMATAVGARDPQMLADQLQLVIDGAYSAGQALGVEGPAKALASAGRALIAAAVDA